MLMYTVTVARGVSDKWRSVPVLLLCTLSPWQGLYLASGGQYIYSCTPSSWQGVYLASDW